MPIADAAAPPARTDYRETTRSGASSSGAPRRPRPRWEGRDRQESSWRGAARGNREKRTAPKSDEQCADKRQRGRAVSYTHLRAHETGAYL
eukprot:5746226-Pyramimonas_sp.AAC.1